MTDFEKFPPAPRRLASISSRPNDPAKSGIPKLNSLLKNVPPFLGKKSPWYLPPRQMSVFEMEFWEPIYISEKDNVRRLTSEVEERYRDALGY